MKKSALIISKVLIAIAFWLFVWILVAKKVGSELLFPTPFSVFHKLSELAQDRNFWLITSLSLLRVLWGILVSWILGSVLAYLLHISKILNLLLSPMITAVKSTPVASFIILALLWMDRGSLPAFITALIVVPIVWGNVTEGIHSVDKNLIEVAEVYHFSLSKRLFRLYIPSIAPYFMAACKSSLGMAWKAGIAAEILATPDHSIGKELYFSKTYFETPTLFAWTLVVIILSLLIEKLLVFGLSKIGDALHLVSKGARYAEN